jgi:hypothetical protein
MPYQPYDTGWIKWIYSILCLGWFLLSNGLLPRYTLYELHNNLWNTFTTSLIKLCESTGANCITVCTKLVKYESLIFDRINYISPIYNMIQYIISMMPNIDAGTPSSFKYAPSNTRRRKTSTGKHLCLYFARKRRKRRCSIISGSIKLRNDKNKTKASPNQKCFYLMETNDNNFYPIDDPSCQDNTWYDAISPYWTGVWFGTAHTSSIIK